MSTAPPRKSLLVLIALLVAAVARPALVAGQAAGIHGVLVLRNGNVLEGDIRRHGDYYRIDLTGASFQVPAAQVDMYCGTLDEAYERRRRDRSGESADAHLELARWCIRHSLLEQASREVLDARTADPGHPGLRMLDAQLGQMLQLRAAKELATPQPASAVQPAALETAVEPRVEPPAPVGFDVSPAAQSEFVRRIQPMLVHGCATGCHTPDSRQQLQLDRWALEGSGDATRIRRNLAAAIRQIDKDDPASSPLVQWARASHGDGLGKASKPLAPYQAALLMDWVNSAAGVTPPPADAAAGVPAPLASDMAADGADSAAEPDEPTITSRRAAAEKKFTPRDEFDAEIFNRRYVRPATIERSPPLDPTATALPESEAEAEAEAEVEVEVEAQAAPAE